MNNDVVLDPRRLELLMLLSKHGSMRAVADLEGVTTSTVSQQIAALSRDVGVPLVEPAGRLVRLTLPGRRLAEHAVGIVASLEAAQHDLDPTAEPRGTIRVASFATGVRRSLMPVIRTMAATLPDLTLQVLELEPPEALAAVAAGEVDLALSYDYTLAPAAFDETLRVDPLWEARWCLGVPTARAPVAGRSAVEVFRVFAGDDWIVNSRHNADEEVVRTVGALAGFAPRIVHRADSLELVQDLVGAGLGVGLLPEAMATIDGVSGVVLRDPQVALRSFVVTRRGRAQWPPLGVVRDLLLG